MICLDVYKRQYVQYTMKLTVAQFFVISASIVACLIWDAVNDLLMGIIIENCHFKWGKDVYKRQSLSVIPMIRSKTPSAIHFFFF